MPKRLSRSGSASAGASARAARNRACTRIRWSPPSDWASARHRAACQVPPPPALPVQDPVRPVDQVLVEEIGDPRGELVPAEVVGRVREVGAERGERLPAHEAGQHPHEPPDQGVPVVRGALRHVGQEPAEEAPDQAGGEREVQVGGNAQPVREPHPEPAGHPVALDGDGLRRERRRKRRPQRLGQLVRQELQAVALMEDQHETQGNGVRAA